MSDFDSRYRNLNAAQKQAVDTLDGPVMVVAGPGTGKTELLSMRVANILKKTDSLPANILCLTYTESGAHAMRERLAGLIGADAYKVAIHTFHSFGSEIINRNAEYFYHGAYFRPADELSSYEILRAIFEKLPHDNRLSSKMNDEFTYLRDVQVTISDLKKSGLTSDELLAILDRNDRFIEWFQPQLDAVLSDRLSKKSFDAIGKLAEDISSYKEDEYQLVTYEPLHDLVRSSLQMALENAVEDGSTKPLSAWKREWCEKREDGSLTLKDAKRSDRLRAVAGVYYDYLIAMQKKSLFDFDDMILRTVHALEVFTDLRLNLQEQYQYILVDEFQDTNDAQMRMLWNLTNNPSSEGKPNVMIVGDDDQAIYRFQGANLSNILDFRSLYRDVAIVTLRDNYRSAHPIIELAQSTISHAGERLATVVPEINKTLTPHYQPDSAEVLFRSYPDTASEYTAVAERIAAEKKQNPDHSIAIIARHHRQLHELLPYLQQHALPLSYDRRNNVLDTPPVKFLEQLARAVTLLAEQQLHELNGILPELLAHPAWGIQPAELWKLSLESYKSRQFWLETMLGREDVFSDIAEWLIYSAHLSVHEPLEYMIDHLTGTNEVQVANSESDEPAEHTEEKSIESFRSPLRDYYFSHSTLEDEPATYIGYLEALSSIRRHVRDYRPEGQLVLSDYMYCIDQYRQLGISIQATGHITADHQPVELLTAHRSKGLEFDSVYVISLTDSVWGETSRSRTKLIGYPHNLPIGIGGDTSDEHVRLLFVALTRAKSRIHLSTHRVKDSGKAQLPVAYLSGLTAEHIETVVTSVDIADTKWRSTAATITPHSMHELLSDTLKTYKLSATHLCNFLDVSRGGPELFLLQNLLRFPQAMSPSAAFGSAVHATLQRAHAHLTATGKKRPIEDLLNDFETALTEHQLASDQHEYFAKKGGDVLSAFLAARYDSFHTSQRVEQSFGSDHVIIADTVRLSGAIDLLDIDEQAKTIVVTDYKTGKSTRSWQGKTDYEKVKLHHYKQQLMFYKILIENSRQYTGYTVTKGVIEYVEPDSGGIINRIELDYDAVELKAFEELLRAVWLRIQSLDFTTSHEYEKNLAGILAFERSLTSPQSELLT